VVLVYRDIVGQYSDVIPGEQRETRNPGGITRDLYQRLLDARFRGHDEDISLKVIQTNEGGALWLNLHISVPSRSLG